MPVACLGGSVYFDELTSSPSSIKAGRFGTQNPINRETTRIGRILWSQIDLFLLECLPPAPSLPGQHPDAPYLYVDTISIVPGDSLIDCTGPVATHGTAQVTVNYAPLEYEINRITKNQNFSIEAMSIPFSHQYWVGEATGATTAPGAAITGEVVPNPDITSYIQTPVIEHSYNYSSVPVTDYPAIIAAIRANLGKVNENSFDGIPAESLLFAGGRVSYTYGPTNGIQTFSFDYSFHERSIKETREDPGSPGTFLDYSFGWNHFYRADGSGGGNWDRLSRSESEYLPVYSLSDDFDDLFLGTTV